MCLEIPSLRFVSASHPTRAKESGIISSCFSDEGNKILSMFGHQRTEKSLMDTHGSTHFWFFSVLSCPYVTNSSNIKKIHFMVLVKPIKIKALLVDPQRYWRSRAGILREKKYESIIYYSCSAMKIIFLSWSFHETKRKGSGIVGRFRDICRMLSNLAWNWTNEQTRMEGKWECCSDFPFIPREIIISCHKV